MQSDTLILHSIIWIALLRSGYSISVIMLDKLERSHLERAFKRAVHLCAKNLQSAYLHIVENVLPSSFRHILAHWRPQT